MQITLKTSPTALIPVTEQAAHDGYTIIGSIEFPERDGEVQNGVMAFDRGYSPFGEDRTYGVLRWGRDESGNVSFFWGHYDLTRDEALRVMIEKAGV